MRTDTATGLIYLGIIGFGLGGYIANIFKLIALASVNDPITAMLALRAVGVFAIPLGAILGYF